jgi:hypothetical protein
MAVTIATFRAITATLPLSLTASGDGNISGNSMNINQLELFSVASGGGSFVILNYNNTGIGVTSGQRISGGGTIQVN